MKNYLFLLCLFIIAGCASKTHVSSSANLSTSIKSTTDSSLFKTSLITDRTKTFTTKLTDTNITFTARNLSGYLLPPKYGRDTSARFENEDLVILLNIDKLGTTSFAALPKPKTLPIRVFEHTAVYNDVITTERALARSKIAVDAKSSLTQKRSEKSTTPNTNFWLSIGLIFLIAVAVIWITRKLSLV